MQLALTPEVLFLVGAALLVIALVTVLLVRRRRRARRAERSAVDAEPAAAAWREPPAVDRVASGRTVAAAVAQAFAAREDQANDVPPGGRGDARDRLLAVLLDDPVRAVGAAVELESCRRQLDRLTGALHHERATLRDVLARLSAAGLAPDQLARLSGLSDDELTTLLRAPASLGAGRS